MNTFYDSKGNTWTIQENEDVIILLKNNEKRIFFINNLTGRKLMKKRIIELKN